jgi:hypothetical protein
VLKEILSLYGNLMSSTCQDLLIAIFMMQLETIRLKCGLQMSNKGALKEVRLTIARVVPICSSAL